MKSMKWWIVGGVAGVALIAGGVAGASAYYGGKALPGTAVGGVSVSGMSQDEARAALEKAADATSVTVDVKGKQHEAKLADLGRGIDMQATLDAAYAPSATFADRITHFFKGADVEPVVSADDKVLKTYSEKLLDGSGVAAKDATIAFNEESGTFAVTPSTPGEKIDPAPLAAAADEAAKTFKSASVTATVTEADALFNTEAAQAVATKADGLITPDVILGDGISDYVATPAEKAAWVKIAGAPAAADGSDADDKVVPDASLDEAAIGAWVDQRATDFNEPAVNGKRNVDKTGKVVSVSSEGTPGYTVNNGDKVKADVIAALKAGQTYEGSFDFDRSPEPVMEDREIAAGAENLPYQAAEGEKWIDINLSNASVTPYVGATPANNPIPMVPGKPSTPTVTGTYQVYLKYPSQTMRGDDYVTPDVPSVMYFHGSYALHGAYWRDSFGWSGEGGSHGCVNLPVNDAAWLYDWADMGTTVVSHY